MQLVRGLVTPQIQRRMQLPTLQKYLKIKAQCYLGRNTALENTEDAEDPQDVAQDPQDVAQDPQDVAQDPQDVAQDPQDVVQDHEEVQDQPGEDARHQETHLSA